MGGITVKFKLVSDYVPKGDQPEAIQTLLDGIHSGKRFQTLLGATGTGKTFTMANIIADLNIPTLVMAPNKLLAAQLYQEFKDFFPENEVHYYISYFDYYQPEAYIPQTGAYIEKDSSVNEEIMKFRLASTYSLLTRSDVIVVASVSCIYGIGNPTEWARKSFDIEPGIKISRTGLMKKLISIHYERNDIDFSRGKIRVRGDTVDVFPGYLDNFYRVTFFGDEIESIYEMDWITAKKIKEIPNLKIFPTREYVTIEEMIETIVNEIREEMVERVAHFKSNQKWAEAQRLEERVNYDLEMLQEVGYCKGIENYSRFLDRRKPGEQPACLYDYFPEKFLLIMDESHIGIPQIRGMIKGDQARKQNLVDYGFRLPSALDNRPLKFKEWEKKTSYVICTSATPGPYELEKSGNVWADQVIRPTGLIDPEVEIKPVTNQIDDLLEEIRIEISKGNRVLVTTLTKRMAESISEYYKDLGIKVEYLHSDIDTVERMELIRKLRLGEFDVLIGINLLREGLDIPEVGLVAILDGDKQGFLRDTRSLIQTIGRASRNANGRAVIYADKRTQAIKSAIKETNRRRAKQFQYNKEHNITPQTIKKKVQESLVEEKEEEEQELSFKQTLHQTIQNNADEEEILRDLETAMIDAAKNLEFEKAAQFRDIISEIKEGKKKISQLRKSIKPAEKSHDEMAATPKKKIILKKKIDKLDEVGGFQLLGTTERINKADLQEISKRTSQKTQNVQKTPKLQKHHENKRKNRNKKKK